MRLLYRWLLRFFEQKRNRFLTIIGLFIAAPLLDVMEREQRRFEERVNSNLLKVGRLKLLIEQLRGSL